MPELPEVEVITRRIKEYFEGKKIVEIEIISPTVIKGIEKSEFIKQVKDKVVSLVSRRGKALLLELDNHKVIVIHLKINGQISISSEIPKFAKIGFGFDTVKEKLYVCDRRALAEVRLTGGLEAEDFFKTMGPEPLGEGFSLDYFKSKVKKSGSKIKPFIMDQKVIAGVGNIYASEALFRAKIRPDRVAKSLSDKEIEALYYAIREVLADSIKHGAVLEKYYYDGKKYPSFSGKLCVYGRENKPCPVCGGKIKKVSLAGRGSYFCDRCQV